MWESSEGWTLCEAKQYVEENENCTLEQRSEIIRLQCTSIMILQYENDSSFSVTLGNINAIGECYIDGRTPTTIKVGGFPVGEINILSS